MVKMVGKIGLVLLSFQLSAQIPNWVIDSLIYETKLGRQCDSLQAQQQTEINAMQSLILEQGFQMSNQKQLIKVQAEKIELFPIQMENQYAISKTEQAVLKSRIKALWRWVAVEGGIIAILFLVLI